MFSLGKKLSSISTILFAPRILKHILVVYVCIIPSCNRFNHLLLCHQIHLLYAPLSGCHLFRPAVNKMKYSYKWKFGSPSHVSFRIVTFFLQPLTFYRHCLSVSKYKDISGPFLSIRWYHDFKNILPHHLLWLGDSKFWSFFHQRKNTFQCASFTKTKMDGLSGLGLHSIGGVIRGNPILAPNRCFGDRFQVYRFHIRWK